jgi:hypothetical protein
LAEGFDVILATPEKKQFMGSNVCKSLKFVSECMHICNLYIDLWLLCDMLLHFEMRVIAEHVTLFEHFSGHARW